MGAWHHRGKNGEDLLTVYNPCPWVMLGSVIVWAIAALSGCNPSTPAAPAEPVITKQELEANVIDDHYMIVWVRNEGDEGPVQVSVNGTLVQTHTERGESGATKALRETFTTKPAPPPQQVNDYKPFGNWKTVVRMEKGERKKIRIRLSGYSVWGDVELSVFAMGLPETLD